MSTSEQQGEGPFTPWRPKNEYMRNLGIDPDGYVSRNVPFDEAGVVPDDGQDITAHVGQFGVSRERLEDMLAGVRDKMGGLKSEAANIDPTTFQPPHVEQTPRNRRGLGPLVGSVVVSTLLIAGAAAYQKFSGPNGGVNPQHKTAEDAPEHSGPVTNDHKTDEMTPLPVSPGTVPETTQPPATVEPEPTTTAKPKTIAPPTTAKPAPTTTKAPAKPTTTKAPEPDPQPTTTKPEQPPTTPPAGGGFPGV